MLTLSKAFLPWLLSAATAQKLDTLFKTDQELRLHKETLSYHFCMTQEHKEVECHSKHSKGSMALIEVIIYQL